MSIRKEFEMMKIAAKIELMDRMSDALVYMLVFVGTITNLTLSVVFFKALFLQVGEIGGWNFRHVLALQGTFFFIEAVSWATYVRGFNRVSRYVEYGDLDLLLVKPINLRSFFIYRTMDIFFSIPQAIIGIMIVVYAIGIDFQLLINIPKFLVLIVCAFIIHYSLIVMISTVNFFHVLPQVHYLFSTISNLGKYPMEIYKGFTRLALSIIVPLAFIYTIPVKALFSDSVWAYLVLSPIMALIFYYLGKSVWEWGINKYESAKG